MAVRTTESRLPAGFTAADLGQQAVSATNANVILVSYLSAPVAARRLQNYVVFVTDAAIAGTVQSYDWSFNNGAPVTQTTSVGIAEFTPQNIGSLTVTVNLQNAGNTTLHTVTLTQQVISLNEALELKIEQQENNFPGAAHPETSRELLNDIRPYVNVLLPVATNDAFNKAICSLAYARTLQTQQVRRNLLTEDLARLLNTTPANFYSAAKDGFGLCKTRPQLLAMFLDDPASPGNKYLDAATLELQSGANSSQRTANATAIETAFNALSTNVKVDLFNLLRFPKSHATAAKTIFDGLEARYYPTGSIGATLGVTNDAKRLITEYETGLVAFGTGANPLSASSFSNSVFALFNNQVWTIPVTAIGGAAAGGGAGVTTPATVGIPEKLPTLTFIAHRDTEAGFGAGALGFLRKAFLYHDSYAFNPVEIHSFEELISTLSGSNSAIGRLRIVTHFGAPSGTTNLTGRGLMFLPFFTGQTKNDGSTTLDRQTFAEHFKFGVSDDQGILGQFELSVFPFLTPDFLSGNTMHTATDATNRPYYTAIFRFLQANHHASLVPFGLDQSGTPSAAVLTIMKWAANLFVLNEPTFLFQIQAANPTPVAARPMPNVVKTAMTDLVNAKLATLATATGPATSANITALASAFSSQTLASLGATSFSHPDINVFSSVYLDNHNNFRTQLATVKTRLDNSFVDVRGCRIGQDRNYMQAIRSFFGNAGTEPTISGPEWFQEFGNIGNWENVTEAHVDSSFNTGLPGTQVTSTDVQRDYSAWAGRIGVNSQISFWNNLFNGNAFDFISLTWRSQLPPIGMDSARLAALPGQNYADAIATVKTIFHIDQTAAPVAADCTTFETASFPSCASLITIQTAVSPLTDASPQPDMQTQLTALTGIATTIAATLPATPSPITRAHLDACIDAIKQRLVTLSGVTPLITSIKTRLTDPKAGYRYMMDIGLPLIVQAASQEGDTRLIYYRDTIDNALKSFKKIHFEGPLPAATITAINSIAPSGNPVLDTHGTADPNDDTYNDTGTGLLFARLALDHQDSQTAVCPSEEFHEHIKTEP